MQRGCIGKRTSTVCCGGGGGIGGCVDRRTKKMGAMAPRRRVSGLGMDAWHGPWCLRFLFSKLVLGSTNKACGSAPTKKIKRSMVRWRGEGKSERALFFHGVIFGCWTRNSHDVVMLELKNWKKKQMKRRGGQWPGRAMGWTVGTARRRMYPRRPTSSHCPPYSLPNKGKRSRKKWKDGPKES